MEKIKYVLLWIFNIVVIGAVLYVTFIEPAINSIRSIGLLRSILALIIFLILLFSILNFVAGRRD